MLQAEVTDGSQPADAAGASPYGAGTAIGGTAIGETGWRVPASLGLGAHIEPFGLASALIAWLAFGLVHTLVRVFHPGALAAVDGLSMLAAQSLSIAYQAAQPPLFDWVLVLVQQVVGATAASVYITKYIFMTAAGGFIYTGTLAATGERRVAWMASIAPMLLFNVGQTIHDQSTHSVALIAAIAATYYFFVMIAVRGAWRDYVGLGLSIAAGTLAKYGFLIVPASMALAFLVSPDLRARVVSLRFLAALLVAASLVGPWAAWLLTHLADLSQSTDRSLIWSNAGNHAQRAVSGLISLLRSLVLYLLPAVPVLWLLYPQLLRRGSALTGARRGTLRDVLGLSIGIGVVIACILIVACGVHVMRARYLHALGLLVPVYIIMHLRPDEIAGRRFMMFLSAVGLFQANVATGPLFSPYFPVKLLCFTCDLREPFDGLASQLAARGYARAVIAVEGDVRLGGNLRRYLPEAQFTTAHLRAIPISQRNIGEPCVLLASLDKAGAKQKSRTKGPPPPEPLRAGTPETLTVPWRRSYLGDRSSRWLVQGLQSSDPRCRGSLRQ